MYTVYVRLPACSTLPLHNHYAELDGTRLSVYLRHATLTSAVRHSVVTGEQQLYLPRFSRTAP